VAQLLFLEAEDPDKDITSTSIHRVDLSTGTVSVFLTPAGTFKLMFRLYVSDWRPSMGLFCFNAGAAGQRKQPAPLPDHDSTSPSVVPAAKPSDIRIQAD